MIRLRLNQKNLNRAGALGLFLLIYIFLLTYLKPQLIFKDTIITGGDTASHYLTAVYFKNHLLPHWRIMDWFPGNYAGFPMFQFYFPLPFLIMSLLSLLTPLTIAFKIVSLAGVFSLPLGAYLCLKQMGFKSPEPALGAVFSLPFLFMEANSMWGGNIPSTFAGEFAYGLGLTLAVIYLGRFFRSIESGRHVLSNALILALVGLSNGYTLLFCVAGVSFFLITTRNWLFKLVYILKVNLLAFCFMGFWIVPLLFFMPYTTPYNFVWILNDFSGVIPRILWPFTAFSLLGAAFSLPLSRHWSFINEKALFFLYLIFLSFTLYLTAPKIGLVDIRFIPLGQVFLVLLGAAGAGRLLGYLRLKSVAALALALGTVIWTAHQTQFIGRWMEWNYSGYENKRLWPAFKELNDYLRGSFADPRVAYEHAAETRAVGSLRAFELLPLFAGRATLEGLYMQSSLSAPFVFYIQSEISETYSSPLSNYNYSRFDLVKAQDHLALFNVSHYVTVTGEARARALKTPGLKLEREFPPFALFRLIKNMNRYVIQPDCKPVLVVSSNPKADAFAWFRRGSLEVPVVFAAKYTAAEKSLFAAVIKAEKIKDWTRDLPRKPLPAATELKETVRDSEIIIKGATPGRPLWIKVSYHPGWRVEGADRIWRAGPAFMLIFPTKTEVRLYFGRTRPEYLGLLLSVIAGLGVLARLFPVRAKPVEPNYSTILDRPLAGLTALIRPRASLILYAVSASALGLVLFLIFAVHYQDPTIYYNRGLKYYKEKNWEKARQVFSQALERFPLSPIVDQTLNHLALSYFNDGRYKEALKTWSIFPREYPESRWLAEALYHIGLCHERLKQPEKAGQAFKAAMEKFPSSVWAEESSRRLAEIYAPGELFQKAMLLFDRGRYREAYYLFLQTAEKTEQPDLKERSAYFAAVSLFKAKEDREALAAFNDLVANFPQGEYTAEAYCHIGLINLRLQAVYESRKAFQTVIERYPGTRWSDLARRAMKDIQR